MTTKPQNVYLFDVQASEPQGQTGRHPGYVNLRLFVVCCEAEDAMRLVRDVHPEARFHQVIRRSSIGTTDGVLIDPDVISALPGTAES